jgi:predicted nucleic acid-binding protein
MEAFTIIGQKHQTRVKSGRLSYELRKKGKNVNLTDCYITVMAQENNCAVLTLDRYFKDIRTHLGIHRVDTAAALREK